MSRVVLWWRRVVMRRPHPKDPAWFKHGKDGMTDRQQRDFNRMVRKAKMR